jgi:3-methyladenine DNA glycosylase AlkC
MPTPKMSDISAERLALLNGGSVESAHLTECLAVDFALLAAAAFPGLSPATLDQIREWKALGISRRMAQTGALLRAELPAADWPGAAAHPSDTVRGWACFLLGARPELDMAQRLAILRPLADDGHFGVREWVWMAVRPFLAADLPQAVRFLRPWTAEESVNLRRFASEVLRPRGVWCAHIRALREAPEIGLPLLQPLRADPARYVQDSVANWLNDAAKDRPDWVRELCARWTAESPGAETRYIVKRAMRSL